MIYSISLPLHRKLKAKDICIGHLKRDTFALLTVENQTKRTGRKPPKAPPGSATGEMRHFFARFIAVKGSGVG